MQVGDLALWKATGKHNDVLVVIVKNVEGLNRHYYCQVIEDGSIYVLTPEVLEAL